MQTSDAAATQPARPQAPAVQELLDDGWKYGRAPLSHWDRRIPGPG